MNENSYSMPERPARSVRPGASGVFKGPPRAVGLFCVSLSFDSCVLFYVFSLLVLPFGSVPVNDDGSELQLLVNILIYVACYIVRDAVTTCF